MVDPADYTRGWDIGQWTRVCCGVGYPILLYTALLYVPYTILHYTTLRSTTLRLPNT